MKLLINLCAHDGIISHYTGVGTMVERYILSIQKVLMKNHIDFDINLFTPQYNTDSFGYSKQIEENNKSKKNVKIFKVENGSGGKVNFGRIKNWEKLCENTAKIINNIPLENYSQILNIANDVPYACLNKFLTYDVKQKFVWIPHSTAKIFKIDSALKNPESSFLERLNWENSAISDINKCSNAYAGAISKFMFKHLIEDYNIKKEKLISIVNGEILESKVEREYNFRDINLFKSIEKYNSIMISFGRAEPYKNFEGAMLLGRELGIDTIIIAQSYFKTQPIIKQYKKIAKLTKSHLYIDPPFDFTKYILTNFKGKIIVLVPSLREPMGLIVNEVRRLNKDNILLVANDTDGLKEQIQDKDNGLLIDINNLKYSAEKIKKYFNNKSMKSFSLNSQKILVKNYNMNKNMETFLTYLIGGINE